MATTSTNEYIFFLNKIISWHCRFKSYLIEAGWRRYAPSRCPPDTWNWRNISPSLSQWRGWDGSPGPPTTVRRPSTDDAWGPGTRSAEKERVLVSRLTTNRALEPDQLKRKSFRHLANEPWGPGTTSAEKERDLVSRMKTHWALEPDQLKRKSSRQSTDNALGPGTTRSAGKKRTKKWSFRST